MFLTGVVIDLNQVIILNSEYYSQVLSYILFHIFVLLIWMDD